MLYTWNLVTYATIRRLINFFNKRSFLSAKVSLREGREWQSQNQNLVLTQTLQSFCLIDGDRKD